MLYTRAVEQWKATEAIKRGMPQGRGEVFSPCIELWWHGSDTTVIRPLFPGYIFIRSDMERNELHSIIYDNKKKILSFIRELGTDNYSDNEEDMYELSDLSDDEAQFLDFMLGFKDESGDCVLHMSYGYKNEDGTVTVMEGPLKGYEEHITGVNIRQRKAYLDIEVKGHKAKAGLTVMPKRHYFPNDKEAPELLSDGEEVNLMDLASKMMSS